MAKSLQEQLDAVNKKLEKHHAEWERTSGHALNPAGEIGGIRSRSRRQKARIWVRWDRQASEGVALVREKKRLEACIAAEAREALRPAAEARIERCLRDTLKKGDRVNVAGFQTTGVVVRVNAKTVSVQFPSGYREAVGWGVIDPVDWKERYAAWKAAQQGGVDVE